MPSLHSLGCSTSVFIVLYYFFIYVVSSQRRFNNGGYRIATVDSSDESVEYAHDEDDYSENNKQWNSD